MNHESNNEIVRPEIGLARRCLDIILLIDISGTMLGTKIAALNQAIREIISELIKVGSQHPEVELRFRCIAFSDKAWWPVGPEPESPSDISWKDVTAGGLTATGAAVKMVAEAITVDKMPGKNFPPVMVLLSDGDNTDGPAYEKAIEQLDQEYYGAKAVRLSIGIGKDFNRKQLEKFTNQPEIGVMEARNAVDLTNYIRYATVTVPVGAMKTIPDKPSSGNIVIPTPPPQKSSDKKLELF